MAYPNADRLRAISEHVHSVGSYTQAHEIDLAADLQDALVKALELVQFAVGKDADNNDGNVDRQAIVEICRDVLAKAGAL